MASNYYRNLYYGQVENNQILSKDYMNLKQENKQLKNKNKHIEQWWKETNVIIRNEKSLAVNDNAMNYIESLENKIAKAIDFINEWEKYTKEKRPLEVSMLDLLYIKEILGDKENE